jgi:hypothetical protein
MLSATPARAAAPSRDNLDHPRRLLEALQPLDATLLEADALDPAGERDDGLAREDLPRCGAAAEPGGEVQGAAR